MDTNKQILVIEDDKDFSYLLKQKLESENLTVLLAEDGEKGLEIVQTSPIDLIILDIILPRMDGVTFLYRLDKTNKKDIPVIVLTSKKSTVYPADFVLKGFFRKADTSLDEVTAKVKEVLST